MGVAVMDGPVSAGAGADAFREEECDLDLSRLRRIRAVRSVFGEGIGEIGANGAGCSIGGIGGTHDVTIFVDGVLAFERLDHDRTRDHEIDQFVEEWLALMNGIEGARLLAAQMQHTGGDDAQTGGLEAAQNGTDGVLGDGIGFDDGQGTLDSHAGSRQDIECKEWLVLTAEGCRSGQGSTFSQSASLPVATAPGNAGHPPYSRPTYRLVWIMRFDPVASGRLFMTHYDVFNGDADGLCALQQLRLDEPRDSLLITGPKRDINLLDRVPLDAASVTVLDISLDRNRAALCRLLEAGVRVRYIDHHFAGEIPSHPGLERHLDSRPETCTSLLVDEDLGGSQRAWAVVGTFGDNFDQSARRAAEPLGLSEAELDRLRDLGIYLNYNGYGATVADLHLAPDVLFRRLQPYRDPLAFINEDPTFARLRDGYADDMARARALAPEFADTTHRLFILPAEPWARRAGGVFANELAQQVPEQAHAILTRLPAGGFLVSVRAPLARPDGADDLCRRFPTGGGRRAAAGINVLPDTQFERFLADFRAAFQRDFRS